MAKTLDVELLALTHAQLIPAPDNLRGSLTDVSDLADSIAEAGILQPLRVMPHPVKANRWEIIAGHRRHAAVGRLIEAGRWPKTQPLPCVSAGAVEDASRLQAMLVENLQRVDLDPIEEARGYQRLQQECGLSVRDIAGKVGRAKSVISSRAQLIKLPEAVQLKVSTGELTLELAYKLCQLDPDRAEQLVNRPQVGPLSVYDIDREIRQEKVAKFKAAAFAALDAAHIEVTTKLEWQLSDANGYERLHHNVSPAVVGKLLLPEDRTGLVARINAEPNVLTINIYRAPAAVVAAGPEPSTNRSPSSRSSLAAAASSPESAAQGWAGVEFPLEKARADWSVLRNERDAELVVARDEWEKARGQVLVRESRAASPADVGKSAVVWLCEYFSWEDGFASAVRLGFDAEVEDQEAAFNEWLLDPSNASALAALFMLDAHTGDTMLEVLTQVPQKLLEEVGPRPTNEYNGNCPGTVEEALAMYRGLPEDRPGRFDAVAFFAARVADVVEPEAVSA